MNDTTLPGTRGATSDLGPAVTLALAAACGIAVANIYYNQPMLGVMAADFGHAPAIDLVPTTTQLGYAAGLFFLVPLGDFLDRRRLIVGQFCLLAAALAGAALASTAIALLAASFAVGFAATVAQHIVPLAAALAPAERRGRVVGTVMGGLFCGILLSRTLAGLVAQHAGWREMFVLGVPLALAAALAMVRIVPRDAGRPPLHYGRALVSLVGLWRAEPALRRATATQALLFASFSAFWSFLAPHLAEPSLGLGAGEAGLFGVLGVTAVLAAPMAGRWADRAGARPVIAAGAVAALIAWGPFGLWNAVAGLVAGVVILDLGVQSALIAHQHTVYALRPEARGRLNTLFMTGMFLGGAAGSALAAVAWRLGGWSAVSLTGTAFALAAVALAMGKQK
jgi:predicted MFS family arabinose efflux permease